MSELLDRYRELPTQRKIGYFLLVVISIVLVSLTIYSAITNNDEEPSDPNTTISQSPDEEPQNDEDEVDPTESEEPSASETDSDVTSNDGDALPLIKKDELSIADKQGLSEAAENFAVAFGTVKSGETLAQRNKRVFPYFTGNTITKEYDPLVKNQASSVFDRDTHKAAITYTAEVDSTATPGGTTSLARVILNMNIQGYPVGTKTFSQYSPKYVVDMKKVKGQWKATVITTQE